LGFFSNYVTYSFIFFEMTSDQCRLNAFKWDSARANCARETVKLLCRKKPDLIPLDLTSKQPIPHPVDNQIRSTIQEPVYYIDSHSTDELKQRLIQIWCNLDQGPDSQNFLSQT